jgi:hypothetical protein
MNAIGPCAWAEARRDVLLIELLPLLRKVSMGEFWELFIAGQMRAFAVVWRGSLSAHWSRRRYRLVLRRLAAVAWDVACLRAGAIHMARDHCRWSHEERTGVRADLNHRL